MLLTEMQRVTAQPLGEAEALPFASYRNPELLGLEQREIFERDWVFVCTEADLRERGDYQALVIADEPVVVLRGKDGKLRALSNVCRHRGAVMLRGGGNAKRIVCPFHAWTYEDTGALRGVPHCGEVAVDKDTHGLRRFRVDSLFGLVFVSLNEDAPPLEARFRGLAKYFSRRRIDTFHHAGEIEHHEWKANWKLPMENFVEGYHFFAVHPETVESAARTRDCFYVEGHAEWSITGGSQLDEPSSIKDWLLGRASEVEYLSICLPPNFVCNLYEDYMTWARVLPTGPTTCEIATGYCMREPHEASEQLKEFNARIFEEDREICERVQHGVSSRTAKGGQLVELERAVVDFHQYLGSRLFGEGSKGVFRTEHAGRFEGLTARVGAESGESPA